MDAALFRLYVEILLSMIVHLHGSFVYFATYKLGCFGVQWLIIIHSKYNIQFWVVLWISHELLQDIIEKQMEKQKLSPLLNSPHILLICSLFPLLSV